MPATYTPLRYPGGKTKLYNVIKPYIQTVGNDVCYIEPFAGGAGLAMKLLLLGDVKSIVLNDVDKDIYRFWCVCLNNTDELCKRVSNVDISVDEWYKQKEIISDNRNHTDFERAFALFYLNRCNRSGIINGGPIGGRNQDGKYRIDARFNKKGLIKKIQMIGRYRDSVSVYCLDGKQFISNVCVRFPRASTFINIDPPYVNKGPELYQNSFTRNDHIELSDVIKELEYNWIVTYDSDELIESLYKGYSIRDIELGYSAGSIRKKGHEYLITNMKRIDNYV